MNEKEYSICFCYISTVLVIIIIPGQEKKVYEMHYSRLTMTP